MHEQEKKIVNVFSAFNKFLQLSYSRNVYVVQEQNVLALNLLHASTHFWGCNKCFCNLPWKVVLLFLPPWFLEMLLILMRKITALINFFFLPPVLMVLLLLVQGLQRAEPVLGESPMWQLQWTPWNLSQEKSVSGSVQGQGLGEIWSIKNVPARGRGLEQGDL